MKDKAIKESDYLEALKTLQALVDRGILGVFDPDQKTLKVAVSCSLDEQYFQLTTEERGGK